MSSTDSRNDFLLLLTGIVALAVVGSALVWKLSAIIHAFGEMLAVSIAASTVGVATAAPVAAWVAPAAGAGLAATGAGIVVIVLVRAAKEAAQEPYEWTVPLLGILGGLMLDFAKEFEIRNEFLGMLLTAIVAFLVVIAGAFWKRKDWISRLIAIVLLLAPPASLIVRNLGAHSADVSAAFSPVPVQTWVRL